MDAYQHVSVWAPACTIQNKFDSEDISFTMAAGPITVFFLFCSIGNVGAAEAETASGVNPIRKVTTMLQNMQTKIAAESSKKEKMFDQYMCYCNLRTLPWSSFASF